MSWAFLAALAVAAAHVAAPYLPVHKRDATAAAAAGVATAHVLVGLVPELGVAAETLMGGYLPAHLLALAGVLAVVGGEGAARRADPMEDCGERRALYAVHFGALLLFNVVAGFELLHAERAPTTLALYVASLLVLTVVHDDDLARESPRYRRSGRWWLAGSVVAGCVASDALARAGHEVDERVTAGALALVIGGLLGSSLVAVGGGARERYGTYVVAAIATAALTVAGASSGH